ncbi:hypothetical protein V6Z11_D02G132300 [Gossypium hirsutum]
MAKPIPKVGSRRNGRNSAQKSARRIPKGVIHVQESFNNTIVTIADVRGRVISWSSVGTCGFKGTRRGTPYSSNSPGLGREATLQAIRRSGILLSFIQDVTPIPYNGCRPLKKDRV